MDDKTRACTEGQNDVRISLRAPYARRYARRPCCRCLCRGGFCPGRCFAFSAVLALGTLPGGLAATDADAAHYDAHYGGHRSHDGYRAYPRDGVSRGGPAFPAPVIRRPGPVDSDPYDRPFARRFYYHGYYHYRRRWAATPWGWRMRRVNVCYPVSHYNLY